MLLFNLINKIKFKILIDNEKIEAKNVEEVIFNLEIYIECLRENVISFQNIKKHSFIEKHEFVLEYIGLEENILKMFDKLNTLKISKKHYKKTETILKEFAIYWKDFQDSWSPDLWEIYENIRTCEWRAKILFHDNLQFDDNFETKLLTKHEVIII